MTSPRQAVTGPVVIDTDPGVDDAIALLMALSWPKVDVVGLTTTAGNVPIGPATRNALAILESAGRSDIPVSRGATRPIRGRFAYSLDVHSPEGLTYPLPAPATPTHGLGAVDFLSTALRANSGALTVIALGPLTNLARLYRKSPTVLSLARHVFVMGGAVGTSGNVTPHAEFNFYSDPTAARLVLESGIPITLVDIAPCRRVFLTKDDVEDARPATPAGILAQKILAGWFSQDATRERFYMYDPLTLVASADTDSMRFRSVTMTVDDSDSTSNEALWGRCRVLDETAGPIEIAEPDGVDVTRSLGLIRKMLAWS